MSNCKSCQPKNKTCWNCGVSAEPGEPMMRVTSAEPRLQQIVERWFCSTCYRGLAIGYGLPNIVGVEPSELSEQDILSGVKP